LHVLASVEHLCRSLAETGLLPPDDVRQLEQRWRREAAAATSDPTRFVEWLVASLYVTAYQGELLLRGQANQLFLGDYKILERIAKGRLAGAFKAVHALGQVAVLRVLPETTARDTGAVARFLHAARAAQQLRHANLVRIFEVGQAGERVYLAMEPWEGETLGERLQRRGKLPASEAARLVQQALFALQYLHEQGSRHLGLHPGNLLMTTAAGNEDTSTPPSLKVLDAGLGHSWFEEPVASGGTGGAMSDYLAPEQAKNAVKADIRADIYSLGCVLYHCLAGQPPFPDTGMMRKQARHASETPAALREFNPEIPDGVQQIVDWMLAKDPARRYPTPERAAQALELFLASNQVPRPVPPVVELPVPTPGRMPPAPGAVKAVPAPRTKSPGPKPAAYDVELVPIDTAGITRRHITIIVGVLLAIAGIGVMLLILGMFGWFVTRQLGP